MKAILGPNYMAGNILCRLWLDKLPNALTQVLAPMMADTF